MATFDFYPLTIPYLKQMHAWLQKPHVRAFWDDGDRTEDEVRAHYFQPRSVEQYLILYQKQPIGYIQAQHIEANHELAKFRLIDKQTYGIDLFIGEEEYIGKGMGIDLLKSFITYLLDRHHQLEAVLFDPSQNNPRAIHLFVKLGAKPVGLHDKREILVLHLKNASLPQ